MDTKAVLQLAKILDAVDEHHASSFDMRTWGASLINEVVLRGGLQPVEQANVALEKKVHDCGTPVCIAGWTVLAFSRYLMDESYECSVYYEACDLLDLTNEQTMELFVPFTDQLDSVKLLGMVTASNAAQVLRHLADTDEVDWMIVPRLKEAIAAQWYC